MPLRTLLRRRWVRVSLLVLAVLVVWPFARRLVRPGPPAPDARTLAEAQRVHILRDRYGVPHVFGERDADAAFGLAYAHAEDDWPTIQGVLAASTGRLGYLQLSKTALANDFYAQLVDARGQAHAHYAEYGADFRAVLEAYARGLNYYAARHPREADGRLLPLTGEDIAAGFAHKLPLLVGVGKALEAINSGKPLAIGEQLASLEGPTREFPGSNAHAVSARRSPDGLTRLNVNSHQPWDGPVAWYEAQVVSGEGWNMTGGTFPGAPFILHGHNDRLGWAHTVNSPRLVDVYRLDLDPAQPQRYRFGDGWKALEPRKAALHVETPWFSFELHKEFFQTAHGPALQTAAGTHAVRWAGIGQSLRAAEQWFRMNKASTFAEWRAAMALQAIPMFNTVYADRDDHVFFVYNALLPERAKSDSGRAVLSGSDPALLWTTYLPFDRLPQVLDPPSGFVQSCNSTPFRTTTGPGNPLPEAFPANAGIERDLTNRSRRSLELLGDGKQVTAESFERMKFDRTYSRASWMFEGVLGPLLQGYAPRDADERQALALLRGWDGVADESSVAATLALLTFKPLAQGAHAEGDPILTDPAEAFRRAVAFLKTNNGRVDVQLGEVQRLRRGQVDLPLGGGPDVLNAAYTKEEDGHYIGYQGDSYVLLVEFGKEGARSRSIHQYGAATSRPHSAHYADQAPLFVKRRLKPAWRTPVELRENLERDYTPAQAP